MSRRETPSEENHYLSQHVALLRHSFRHWTGRALVPTGMGKEDAARYLFHAPFAVVSHDTAKEPIFNYANQTALSLFAMDWGDFTALPSRKSAQPAEQAERQRLLDEVAAHGFIDHYSGVRIGRHGRRFLIENAVIWNLLDPVTHAHKGQAALIKQWTFL
jgi:hypothetical protein